jgi:hypothetical protein
MGMKIEPQPTNMHSIETFQSRITPKRKIEGTQTMPKSILIGITLMLVFNLLGCTPGGSATPLPPSQTVLPSSVPDATETIPPSQTATSIPTITGTPTGTASPTPDTRLKPYEWEKWPVVPAVSARVKEIYQAGQQMGVRPNTFTVVGDCQSHAEQFMGVYASSTYDLGSAQYLQETLDIFSGSITHESLAVKNGLSAPSALSPLWADSTACNPTEGPLECELRLYQPMIVFIALGRNWHPAAPISRFEESMRLIVEMIIAHGAIPILINKNDNVEGNWSVNIAIAQVAYDYDLPMINFWRAAGSLPHNGLLDNNYMTYEAIDLRSFYVLKTLDLLRRELGQDEG